MWSAYKVHQDFTDQYKLCSNYLPAPALKPMMQNTCKLIKLSLKINEKLYIQF